MFNDLFKAGKNVLYNYDLVDFAEEKWISTESSDHYDRFEISCY